MTRFVHYGVAVLFGVSGFVLAAVGVKPIFADLLILSAYYLLLAGSWNLLAGFLTLLLAIGLYLTARRTPVALRRA